jgi:hypothetical protein
VPRNRLAACLLTLIAAAGVSAGIAQGELTQSGNLIVSLRGGIAPHALPREQLAPVSVYVDGSIKTANGAGPPPLRAFSVALNRNGRLFTRGLPVCPAGLLESTTTAQARQRCGPALVGHGRFEAHVAFPNQAPFPAEGTLLAFNSKVSGRTAILLHVYGSIPIQHTFVLPMIITRQSKGIYGTVLSTTIPKIAANVGYVTSVNMKIGRRYRYQGRLRSFLSASCAAPAGFPGAIFPFAKGTFSFSNGQTLSTRLIRDCRVKD